MRKSYKASNFLDTIDKYTKRKRKDTIEDMKKQEEAELKKAEEEIIQDVNSMIEKEIISMKNKVFIEISRKQLEERRKFFKRRKEIIEDIFASSKKKLLNFTTSEKYKDYLIRYAKEIAEVLDSSDTVLFVKSDDLKYADIIKESFGKKCEIATSKDIQIGGIRGYSSSQGIMADKTLDTKLRGQEDWAIENFGVLLV